MRPLILSFFIVILAYSLFIDKGKDTETKITPNLNSIYFDKLDSVERADTILYFADRVPFDY